MLHKFITIIRFLLIISFIFLFISMGATVSIFFIYSRDIPDISRLEKYKPVTKTMVYDNNNKYIAEFLSVNREFVKINKVPKKVINAFLAIEDSNFFNHFGLSPYDILRALIIDIRKGKIVQGGSTITQQLAKNLFLTPKRTIDRKIKEAILALQIEHIYHKNEILEFYLNQIFLGSHSYGVETAAQNYFGKHIWEVTIPEAAMIAGLPRAPSLYNPYRNYNIALQRRNYVLLRMKEEKFISPEEYQEYVNVPLTLKHVEEDSNHAPYFIEFIRKELEKKKLPYKQGLKIYTSLNLKWQNYADSIFNKHLDYLEENRKLQEDEYDTQLEIDTSPLQGAVIVIERKTGAIKVFIGGNNFDITQFDRVSQAARQPGSAFKPFTFAAALQKKYTMADIIYDYPLYYEIDDTNVWIPDNFSNKFYGPTTLMNALYKSRNIVTIKLLEKIKPYPVIKLCRKLGFTTELPYNLSLALGTNVVYPIEIAGAYNTFVNNGIYLKPYGIKMIKDDISTIFENSFEPKVVLDRKVAYLMTYMLRQVVLYGTGRRARKLKFPVCGKTGTTDMYRDGWFVGSSNQYTCAVYVGYDNLKPIGHKIVGAYAALPIWMKVMAYIHKDKPVEDFPVPPGIVFLDIDMKNGLLASKHTRWKRKAAFLKGTEPKKFSDGKYWQPYLKRLSNINFYKRILRDN